MTVPELLLLEFDVEMEATRRMLERVPEASFAWKPHEKSMTLGRLASHIADLPQRCTAIITTETLVREPGVKPFVAATSAQVLERFDATRAEARTALAGLMDEQLTVVGEEAEEARLRSLVSETPLAAHEYAEIRRHADAMVRAREALCRTVDELVHRQDELLAHVGSGR